MHFCQVAFSEAEKEFEEARERSLEEQKAEASSEDGEEVVGVAEGADKVGHPLVHTSARVLSSALGSMRA